MARATDSIDPRGLIRESYRIEGIRESECRRIFLDWAIGVPLGEDSCAMIRQLLLRYGNEHAQHPMTCVLKDALGPQIGGVRRGGAQGRRMSQDDPN